MHDTRVETTDNDFLRETAMEILEKIFVIERLSAGSVRESSYTGEDLIIEALIPISSSQSYLILEAYIYQDRLRVDVNYRIDPVDKEQLLVEVPADDPMSVFGAKHRVNSKALWIEEGTVICDEPLSSSDGTWHRPELNTFRRLNAQLRLVESLGSVVRLLKSRHLSVEQEYVEAVSSRWGMRLALCEDVCAGVVKANRDGARWEKDLRKSLWWLIPLLLLGLISLFDILRNVV